jgi:hypothetical protein
MGMGLRRGRGRHKSQQYGPEAQAPSERLRGTQSRISTVPIKAWHGKVLGSGMVT